VARPAMSEEVEAEVKELLREILEEEGCKRRK
jgi:quinol monooxygenase YgiN